MNYEPHSLSIDELIDRIMDSSLQSLELLTGDEKEPLRELMGAASGAVIGWRQRPLEFNRETIISDVTGLAYRLSNALFDESYWEACERLSFLSYQLASAVDWRERALGALKLALLAGSSMPRWDDLDRLRSRVRQRIRRLLGTQSSFDRLPNGIDLNRLTDDVVWKIWDRLWHAQPDDDGRRTLLRKNLRFGWNYTFTHINHPARVSFRQYARQFLAGDVATRIATGEIEAEWIDLFEPELSEKIAEWTTETDSAIILGALEELSEQLTNRLSNGIVRWLEWWRPLKTLREGDREAIELFREAQQLLFEEQTIPRAVDTFRTCFDLAPSDLGVKEWYAYSLILVEDYSSAERLLQQIITARRQDFATITNLAGIYVRTGRLMEAAELLCPQELYERNLYRRPYVAAVLSLLIGLKRFPELPARIQQLESPEWLAIGVANAIRENDEFLRDKLVSRLIDTASIAVGKKGSDLSDPNDPLVPIVRLEKDFAYFQTEGLIEEGVTHFKQRTERYPWFWANWHYLGKLYEMSGNVHGAKDAFRRKAEATSGSKAPRKSKIENWHYYLEFCFRNELYEDLRVGIEGAQAVGMPDAKLLRYRRALGVFENPRGSETLSRSTFEMGSDSDGEEFISPNATSGLIAFEFVDKYPEYLAWKVEASGYWNGSLSILPHNRQEPSRRELAVNWVSNDGTLPSAIRLQSLDGSVERTVKLYRTDRNYAPIEHLNKVNLLELYPDIQTRIRRHIISHLPGEVLAVEAPSGFGVNQLLSHVSKETEVTGCSMVTLNAPSGAFDVQTALKWLADAAGKCTSSLLSEPPSYGEWATAVDKIFAEKTGNGKTVVVVSGFAEQWNTGTDQNSKAITTLLDGLFKLTEHPDQIWIFGTADLFHLRRKIIHGFWRSLQTLRMLPLSEDQLNTLIAEWFDEANVITGQAVATIFYLSGGVYEIVESLLHAVVKEANAVEQQRILAANVVNVASWVTSSTSVFRQWANLTLPSQKPARAILDRLNRGDLPSESDPDLTYLRETGIVIGKAGEYRIVSSLYQPRLLSVEATSPAAGSAEAIVIIDHENLFLGLKDNALRQARPWNDRDPQYVGAIADRILSWVRREHSIKGNPIAIANWDIEPFVSHMRPYQRLGYYTLLPEGPKENSADFLIYTETARLLRESPSVKTVVLITGDGDFTMLVRSLKSQEIRVRVVGVSGSASIALRAAVGSDFQFIEPIIEA